MDEVIILHRRIDGDPEPTLDRSAYFEVRDAVWRFLSDNEVSYLPVDVEVLFAKNGWSLLKFSEVKEQLETHFPRSFFDGTYTSFTIIYKEKAMVIYDEEAPITRLRYSLAREIGRIVLKHRKNTLEEALQADMFAVRLLMPACVLNECKVTSAEEISELCETSLSVAEKRFARLETLKERSVFLKSDQEKQVLDNFKDFIKGYREYNKK